MIEVDIRIWTLIGLALFISLLLNVTFIVKWVNDTHPEWLWEYEEEEKK